MSTLSERIESKELLAKVMPVEEAVKLIPPNAASTIAISGFTKSGEPKAFLPALAKHLAKNAPDTKISLFSGASLSEEVEGPLSPFIVRRGPYMSSSASRKLIHSGRMDFTDVHLSAFGRNLMYGFYGDIDFAVIEVSRIRPNGSVVLSSSVGISVEALSKAKKIILEVNTVNPDYTGFHDL
jgi:acyl-CoA hydrolase